MKSPQEEHSNNNNNNNNITKSKPVYISKNITDVVTNIIPVSLRFLWGQVGETNLEEVHNGGFWK